MNRKPNPHYDMKTHSGGVLIRAKEVASMCSVSVRTIERWRAAGIIQARKICPGRPGAVLYDREAVKQALTRQDP